MEDGNDTRPCTAGERRQLRRWERRQIAAFVATMVLLVVVVAWPFGERTQLALFAVLLAGVAGSVALQFSGHCPRCGANLGLQTRLLLPPACKRCGGRFRD